MKANSQIIKEVCANGFITEGQIRLLKNRSNRTQNNVLLNSSLEDVEVKVTAEQGRKGLNWLKKFIKKNGESRKINGRTILGNNEIQTINEATENDFLFLGFIDTGSYGMKFYEPVYKVGEIKYYYELRLPVFI